MSNLENELRNWSFINIIQYYIYADSGYVLRLWLQISFPRHSCTQQQAIWNKSMNVVQTSVEWSYGEIKQYFTSQDFSRKL